MTSTILFRNSLPNGISLYIEYNLERGIYTLISHRNDSTHGDEIIEILKLTFNDKSLFEKFVSHPVTGKDFNYLSEGTAEYYQKIHQTGSAWDSEETVVGIENSWTKTGQFSVTVQLDDQYRLVKMEFDTRPPYSDPRRSMTRGFTDVEKPEYEINPWGYPIHMVGETIVIGKEVDNQFVDIAHKVKSVSEEPLYFTPECDIPVYETDCGCHGGNDYHGSGWHSYFPTGLEILQRSIKFCPTCFPPK